MAALLALSLPLAGCGDDGDGSSATPKNPNGITTSADASMWDDGTAECEVTGTAAAEVSSAKPAEEGIDGVVTFGKLTQNHVKGCVDYPVSPPVGGDHNQAWANCGFYSSAVPNEHAVHDLEHGAVWIAFGEDVSRATVDAIRLATSKSTHLLASPYPDLGTKVVLSAWSRQLTLDSVSDARFQQFIDEYVQGPQTPELGASCDGAMGEPD